MLVAIAARAALISGSVTDEDGAGVPFVTVYVEGTTMGTTTNSEGAYSLDVANGYRTMVFRYVGYKTEIRPVTVDGPVTLDIVLKRVVFQLGEVNVDGNEDPAYRIMRLARSRRKFYQKQVKDYSCKVYVKGLNYVKNLPKRILGRSLDITGLDKTRSGIVYLSESLSEFHFQAPDKTKERVIASKVSGNSQGFTWNNATSLNFNFYDRTYNLEGLSDRDLVSPLSPSANLYYRYIYRGFYIEDSIIVNKIELIPRVKGVPLFKGHIFIQENSWRIHGADVFMTSESGIDFVDTARMKVDFIPLTKDLWMKGNMSFDFAFNVKLFKVKGWGTFTSVFSDYNIREFERDTVVLKRYDEVEEPTEEDDKQDLINDSPTLLGSVGDTTTVFNIDNWSRGSILKVESEANEKDETFWNTVRTIPLTALETRDYAIKDSIETVKETKVYKDSIDRKNNKFAARNLLYGYTYQNTEKEYSIDFQTPLTAIQFNTVEGYLIDYEVGFSRRKKKEGSSLSIAWQNRYGFYSGKYYSKARIYYRFNRMNRMYVRAEGGHYVNQFHGGAISPLMNSLYSVFLEENYMKLYEHSFGEIGWGMEVVNGLRVRTAMYFGQRNELKNATDLSSTFLDQNTKKFTINEPANGSLPVGSAEFGPNLAWVWRLALDYQPGAKYMERPDRKINLGTKWPRFGLRYERGIGGFAGIASNYDKIDLTISDNHSLGLVGRLEWEAGAGWFPNNKFVSFIDRQHFNTSRVHVMPTGLARFKALPYYISSTDQYYAQAHLEQHFNGFIFNKIPLIKKLKWQTVGGIHYLFEPTFGNYWEVTAGIENIFRIIRVDFVFPFREEKFQQFTFRFQLGF